MPMMLMPHCLKVKLSAFVEKRGPSMVMKVPPRCTVPLAATAASITWLLKALQTGSAALKDPEMVSGMLTAIQDFVRDSFGAGGDETLEMSAPTAACASICLVYLPLRAALLHFAR